jgi:hypothetical protein
VQKKSNKGRMQSNEIDAKEGNARAKSLQPKALSAKKSAIERSTTELYARDKRTAGIEPATIRILPWSCRGLNPGLCACKAHDLPLIYNPLVEQILVTAT